MDDVGKNNANSNGMIVHWFIEPVSYCKESASDIENPFENKNVPHSIVTRRSRQTSKN